MMKKAEIEGIFHYYQELYKKILDKAERNPQRAPHYRGPAAAAYAKVNLLANILGLSVESFQAQVFAKDCK